MHIHSLPTTATGLSDWEKDVLDDMKILLFDPSEAPPAADDDADPGEDDAPEDSDDIDIDVLDIDA